MLLLFENCPMNFKTVKKLISCALPAWLLLGSGQNLIGSARFWSVPARFWSVLVGSCYIKYDCENSNERRHDATRQGLDYRQKYLDIEVKFDEYRNRSAIEMKKMLRIYNASSKNGPLEIASMKQRLVQLEMDLKNKDEVLDKMDSIDMKTEYMENVLKEVQIQSQRSAKINERHIEEDELRSMHQNKLKDFLAEQKCLDRDKVNTIKKLTRNQEELLSLLAKKNDEIYKLKNNVEINDTNPSHVNESIHQEEHMKQQRIKTQIILNPDFKKRPVTEKTVLHEVIVGNKQQQFHLKEIERAVYYLSK